MSANNETFKKLLKRNKLTTQDAANLLNKSIDTIKAYLSDPATHRYREINDNTLKLFKIQITRRRELLKNIPHQFNDVIKELEEFTKNHTGYKQEELNFIISNDEKFRTAKKLYSIASKINDIWINFIMLDTDGLMKEMASNQNI